MVIADDDRLVLTIEEAGKLLGLGRSGTYEAARRGDIPTLRIGSRILVPKVALLKLLEETARWARLRNSCPRPDLSPRQESMVGETEETEA
ncbi:uncharacterized protein METZ01_LOCUS474078 [marine metagenome]|uniref:Helix-turn-helix domain-containing protein n=1 Tax=marine metagenome TaxID=408172 RepID=A0A383BMU9_9ZZZZ